MSISILRKSFINGFMGIALVTCGLSAAAAANTADHPVNVRGTVVSLAGDRLQLKSREGQALTVTLNKGWAASAVVKASIGDIKPGDFVGIASLPESAGGDGALEVLIFPPAAKGTGEGSYGWDLKPNSMMTNATVGDAVKSVDGSTVTVTYHGKEKKIAIPNGTPVVTLVPATAADVKPGTAIFSVAKKDAQGMLSTSQVLVGKNGVVPPM
ncbi:hypothetical protein D781_3825 [Serratia sp. FGI94]|uniref:hypothetical protein n=1 Tax=Serratia sp. FGI94 TaxID=671990 RepID=UPI0002A72B27|nr:hypothetical protein [Serratia sp. FGI94]AGB84019.1 hypothetical protein D781_3825 [Serratia sp. FGI94]